MADPPHYQLLPHIYSNSVKNTGIVSRHRSGESSNRNSSALKVHKSTCIKCLKWNKFGTTRIHPRADCGAKVSNWERRAFVRKVTRDPMVTLAELKRACVKGRPEGRTTITTTLHRSGLYGRVVRQKSLLRERHMKAPEGLSDCEKPDSLA